VPRLRLLTPCLALLACSGEHDARPKALVATKVPAPIASASPQPVVAEVEHAKPACEPLKDLGEVVSLDDDHAVPPVIDEGSRGMAHFYARLAELLRGKASDHVRIGVFGDSNTTRDFITGEMRRVLQKKLGDGGHGFVALAKPWVWYRHMDVQHGFSSGTWEAFAISTNPALDGYHGFAGIAAQSRFKGATSWVATALDEAPIGRTVSALDVHYLRRSGNGSFEVKIDGDVKATIETGDVGPGETVAGFRRFDVEDAPHKVSFSQNGSKPVRLFGVTMERTAPGVLVDSLGVVGVNIQMMATKNDAKVVKATLARRKYDLVIFLTGTNEASLPEKHDEWMKTMIDLHRQANPDVSILVMSPPDHMEITDTHSSARIVRVSNEKRTIAEKNRAAFWDFREAMGGDASIKSFSRKKWALPDLIHLTEPGGLYMGDRVAFALWRGFSTFLAMHPDAGCAN